MNEKLTTDWRANTTKNPFHEQRGPIEVELVDGTRETWLHPKKQKKRNDDVAKWRNIPGELR